MEISHRGGNSTVNFWRSLEKGGVSFVKLHPPLNLTSSLSLVNKRGFNLVRSDGYLSSALVFFQSLALRDSTVGWCILAYFVAILRVKTKTRNVLHV